MATPVPADGRHARTVRSRDAVVNAVLELVEESGRRPSVEEVSARAGVSERTIFRIFESLDALVAAAVARRVEMVVPLVSLEVPSGLPLVERVNRLCEHRAILYEATSTLRFVAEPMRRELVAVDEILGSARIVLREQLGNLFASELAVADRPSGSQALDAVEVITMWSSWRSLRVDLGLGVGDAVRVMARAVEAIVRDSQGSGAPAK